MRKSFKGLFFVAIAVGFLGGMAPAKGEAFHQALLRMFVPPTSPFTGGLSLIQGAPLPRVESEPEAWYEFGGEDEEAGEPEIPNIARLGQCLVNRRTIFDASLSPSANSLPTSELLTVTYTLTNSGDCDAIDVRSVIVFKKLSTMHLVSVSTTQGTCQRELHSSLCRLGTIPTDATVTITAKLKPTSSGSLEIEAGGAYDEESYKLPDLMLPVQVE